MRVLSLALTAMLALPVAAQAGKCRGIQSLDLGGGTTACVVAIEEDAITTTTTRDDGASEKVRTVAQPMVAAVMSGPVPTNRATVKKQALAMCKATLAQVTEQFAGMKYNRIILVMDWRDAKGKVEAGFSSAKCRGFKFFNA